MVYQFFFSYTRNNTDIYLKGFFKDLSNAVRDKLGLGPQDAVGFFDQRELELGEAWDQSIVAALQSTKVFIAVMSPAYLKSEYCGKEWALFEQRIRASFPEGAAPPPVLKPLIWIPFDAAAPLESVGTYQYTLGDPGEVHNQSGLKYMFKQRSKYRPHLIALIESLAQQIVDAQRYELPALPAVPALADTRSAFAPLEASVDEAGTSGGRTVTRLTSPIPPTLLNLSPTHVRFVYVAADPAQFGNARRSEPYIARGGADWKPFYPASMTRVHRAVQFVASADDLDLTSESLPFSSSLLDDIEDACTRREIVILIVDGWSLYWGAHYRDILMRLDQRLDYHWCVLVPWNEDDPDSMRICDEIRATLGQTFDRHANLSNNPLFYQASITSEEQLKKVLREKLTRLKEEIRKRADVRMPVPAGPGKAIISGPSAGG
jgi:FxsC-like protein